MVKRKPTHTALPVGDPFLADDNLELSRLPGGTWYGIFQRPGYEDIVLEHSSLVAIMMEVFGHARALSDDGYTTVPVRKGRR